MESRSPQRQHGQLIQKEVRPRQSRSLPGRTHRDASSTEAVVNLPPQSMIEEISDVQSLHHSKRASSGDASKSSVPSSKREKQETALVTKTAEQSRIVQLRLRNSAGGAIRETNFATPDNDLFYSRNPYVPLSASRREIRLLRIHSRKTYAEHISTNPAWTMVAENQQPMSPAQLNLWVEQNDQFQISSANAPILAGELLDTALSRVNGLYHTISYCAGERNDTKLMLVNGLPFNAFANLEHAISCVSRDWERRFPGRELLLWVDQICIDQRNPEEKAHQVQIMSEIYKRCVTTFVCLDTKGKKHTLRWAGGSDNVINVDALAQKVSDELLPTRWPPAPPSALSVRSSKLQSDSASDLPPGQRPWLMSLHRFLTSPYWERAWVYQEFVLAADPQFTSDAGCLDWKRLLPLLRWLCSHFPAILQLGIDSVDTWETYWRQEEIKQREALVNHNGSEARRMQMDYEKRKNKVLSGEEVVGESGFVRSGRDWGDYTQAYFLDHLQRAQTRREKLMVVREIQSRIIELGQKREQQGALHKLQRWVARYEHEQTTLEELLLRLLQIQPPRLHERLARIPSQDEWDIERRTQVAWLYKLHRCGLGAIQSMMLGHERDNPAQDLMSLLQHSRHCQSTDERDRVFAFLSLAHEGHDVRANYGSWNTIVHVLIQAALGLIKHGGTLDILHHVYQGRDQRGLYIPTWVPDWTSRRIEPPLDKYAGHLRKTSLRDALPFRACHDSRAEPKWRDGDGPQHVDLQVEGWHIGELRRCNETLVDLDSAYSEGLSTWRSSESSESCPDYRVVTTKDVARGDQIWVLGGAKMPVILRSEGNMTFSFLGECLLMTPDYKDFVDLMFGAAPQRSIQVQTIFLV